MKTTYQQYISSIMPAIRVLARKGVEFEAAFRMIIEDVNKRDANWGNVARMERRVALKKCVHLFVRDEAFLDWLLTCAPTVEDGSPEAMREMTGGEVCVLHFPTTSKYRCVVFKYFGPEDKFEKDDKPNMCQPALCVSFTRIGDSAPFCYVNFDQLTAFNFSPLAGTHVRLLNALGLYLSCFPEMLRAGPPDDVKHPSHHQYAVSKTIDISPKVRVLHSERGEVTAHFRKGHFRTLRSDRFTHKRFQVVFIRATFVKGESLTVLSPEEEV